MWKYVERALTIAIAVAALVATVSIVKVGLLQSSPGDRARPERIDTWDEVLAAGTPVRGPGSAPIVIAAMMDLQCPACRGFSNTLRELAEKHPQEVRIVYVHHPLDYHDQALAAARAAVCAERTGEFTQFVEAVYAHQDSLGSRPWSSYAAAAGIADTVSFRKCTERVGEVPSIREGLRLGKEIGLQAVPTVIVNGWMFPRTPTQDELEEAVESLLAGERPE